MDTLAAAVDDAVLAPVLSQPSVPIPLTLKQRRDPGLSEVESGSLATSARYADFDDFWEPFTFAVGPAGSYLRQQDADRQQAIRYHCFALLGEPSGPFELEARAWYARGTVPS